TRSDLIKAVKDGNFSTCAIVILAYFEFARGKFTAMPERRLSRYGIVAVEIWDFGRERIWD
ncbi:MAG: hypothetical protein KAU41_05065, partial [Deltaproteobacteria bacterium]|nr:hypothetical protein [Deltaproteobacteria bacterium]